MEEEIALLRREALSSISAKGSRYRVDSLFDRSELRRKRGRPRCVSPDITREVMGAFGIKPKKNRQYVKESKSKPRVGQRRRSTTSSPSRSGSRTYSSYSSSSQSRSRSSSSSSSYSSSYSGSSRSPSPKSGPRTPPQRTSKKVTHRSIPSSSSDRILEYHQRKKPRYAEDVSPPRDFHHYDSQDQRRPTRSMHDRSSRRRSNPRQEPPSHHSLPSRRGYSSNDDYHHPPRHHPGRYQDLRSSYPPPSHHHSSPPRPRYREDRGRPTIRHDLDKGYSHRRDRRVEHDSPAKLKSRYYGEGDREMYRRSSEKVRHIDSPDRSQVHKNGSNMEHHNQDRYIVLEDSEGLHSSKKAFKASKDREETHKKSQDKSPSVTYHAALENSPDRELEIGVHPSNSANVENTSDLDSPLEAGGNGSFVEELDYNEDMDNLDLHPTGVLEGGAEEGTVVNDASPPKAEKEISQLWSDKASDKDSDGSVESQESSVEARPISSPLRVSPERSGRRGKSWSGQGRMPVKQRLYISRQKIEEKKRSAHYHDHQSSSELRPSLANRLGPPQSHHSRRAAGGRRRHHSDGPVKGDAMAIAKAVRRRKAAEKKGVRIHLHKSHDHSEGHQTK